MRSKEQQNRSALAKEKVRSYRRHRSRQTERDDPAVLNRSLVANVACDQKLVPGSIFSSLWNNFHSIFNSKIVQRRRSPAILAYELFSLKSRRTLFYLYLPSLYGWFMIAGMEHIRVHKMEFRFFMLALRPWSSFNSCAEYLRINFLFNYI